jgi:hypothetical protein
MANCVVGFVRGARSPQAPQYPKPLSDSPRQAIPKIGTCDDLVQPTVPGSFDQPMIGLRDTWALKLLKLSSVSTGDSLITDFHVEISSKCGTDLF